MEYELVVVQYEIKESRASSTVYGYVVWDNSYRKWYWEKTAYAEGRSRPIFDMPEEALEGFKEYVKNLHE